MALKMNGLSLEMLPHPGETIKEIFQSKKVTLSAFAKELDIRSCIIKRFIDGDYLLESSEAIKMSIYLGLNPNFINNLNSIYLRYLKFELKKINISYDDYSKITKLTLKTINNNFNIFKRRVHTKLETYDVIKKFEEKSNLIFYGNNYKIFSAFRSSDNITNFDKFFYVGTLVTQRENKAPMKKYENVLNIDSLKEQIREITFIKDFAEVLKAVEELLKTHGINFYYFDYDRDYKISGFILRNSDEITIGVSNKSKYLDVFLFTLCHELGHLRLFEIDVRSTYYSEEMSDIFSSNILIDNEIYSELISYKNITGQMILEYSQKLNIAPGILVGRLQHDKIISFAEFNYLRKKI